MSNLPNTQPVDGITFRSLSETLAFDRPIDLALYLSRNNLPMHYKRFQGLRPSTVLEPTFAATLMEFVLAKKFPNEPSPFNSPAASASK